MRIREIKEVEREIIFEKACVYYVSEYQKTSTMFDGASEISKHDGYVEQSLVLINNKPHAKFRVPEDREMTDAEELAWHCLEAVRICKDAGSCCVEDCPFAHCDCPISYPGYEEKLKKVFEGKEVINDE